MVQVIEMTKEEKLAMYMKLPKKQLAEMLYECNRLMDRMPIFQVEDSKPLGDFESNILQITLKKSLKSKPTIKGRK